MSSLGAPTQGREAPRRITKRGFAPFSLIERDKMGRIVRVTPLRFLPRSMFPRPNKNSARFQP